MTLLTPINSRAVFGDLRQQFATLLSDASVSPNERGKLPESQTPVRKRGTLHLNESTRKATDRKKDQ